MKKYLTLLIFPFLLTSLSSCNAKPKEKIVKNSEYILYQNRSYGDHYRHRYDICFPKQNDKPNGLLFYIHGGGWVAGDKDGFKDTIINTAKEQHFVTAALDYRYADLKEVHYNEIMDDLKNCIQNIKELGRENNLVLKKMITIGGSAGGHLSLLYSYKMKDKSPIAPVAAISYCGPTDLTDPNFYNQSDEKFRGQIRELLEKISGTNLNDGMSEEEKEILLDASPISYVDNNTVPTLIGHGQIDEVVPCSNSVSLKDKLDEFNIKSDFITYPNSGHGLENDPTEASLMEEKVIEYYEYLN